jgi:hypothetical protein
MTAQSQQRTSRTASCQCGNFSAPIEFGQRCNHFCPECGTTLFWRADLRPDHIGVAVGACNDPDFAPPSRQPQTRLLADSPTDQQKPRCCLFAGSRGRGPRARPAIARHLMSSFDQRKGTILMPRIHIARSASVVYIEVIVFIAHCFRGKLKFAKAPDLPVLNNMEFRANPVDTVGQQQQFPPA